MDRLPLYRELDRVFPRSYPLKLFWVGAFGSFIPLLVSAAFALTGPDGWAVRRPELLVILVATVASSALALIGLRMMLAPIAIVSDVVASYRKDRIIKPFKIGSQDSVGRLLSNVLGLLAEVEQMLTDSERLAFSDELTGLLNRKCLDLLMNERFNEDVRKYGSVHIAIFDIDEFGWINEEFGALIGDAILTTFADILRRAAKNDYLVSRIGGKQFAVVFAETPLEKVDAVCEQVRQLIKQRHVFPIVVTVSIGIATRLGAERLVQTLARAERAVHQAKRAGSNKVMYAEAETLTAAE